MSEGDRPEPGHDVCHSVPPDPPGGRGYVKVHAIITQEQRARLQQLAKVRHCSVSVLLRQAVDTLVGQR
jgi:hypothetical protein